MPEISLNILDVTENSIRAEATEIALSVIIDSVADTLTVTIKDNGSGMTDEQLAQVQNPFFTTRTTRKVGLGVPFLKQAAEMAGGNFSIQSMLGKGTEVEAVFGLSNIDRMPLGDMTETVYTLVVFHETIHFIYTYQYDEKQFTLDTKEIREIVGEEVSFSNPEISGFIRGYLEENKDEVDAGRTV